MKVKINYNAIGTWLEPYIGYVLKARKKGRRYEIQMDYGDHSPFVSVENHLIDLQFSETRKLFDYTLDNIGL